jgi:hypothetical protein
MAETSNPYCYLYLHYENHTVLHVTDNQPYFHTKPQSTRREKMISILSNSFRTATRMERQTDGQRPVFRDETKDQKGDQTRAKQELRRWKQRWFMG